MVMLSLGAADPSVDIITDVDFTFGSSRGQTWLDNAE